jgi:hypothetical protein
VSEGQVVVGDRTQLTKAVRIPVARCIGQAERICRVPQRDRADRDLGTVLTAASASPIPSPRGAVHLVRKVGPRGAFRDDVGSGAYWSVWKARLEKPSMYPSMAVLTGLSGWPEAPSVMNSGVKWSGVG